MDYNIIITLKKNFGYESDLYKHYKIHYLKHKMNIDNIKYYGVKYSDEIFHICNLILNEKSELKQNSRIIGEYAWHHIFSGFDKLLEIE